MPLNSYAFLLIFLPMSALAGSWCSGRPRARGFFLVASSLLFYAFAGAAPLALLLLMIGLTFAATRTIGSDEPGPRRLGLALLLGNVAVLVLLKTHTPLFDAFGALPLGVSFYTFNLLSHGLDVYWQRSGPASLGGLLAYGTFFPTVSSGPLMRYDDFHAQAAAPARLSSPMIDRAVVLLAVGLGKKVIIADSIAAVIDPLFERHEQLQLGAAWTAVVGQHLRVYFDFAGYTDVAIGAGLLVGVAVPANFAAPYTARSLTEFWQRWHITLSTWFRDYVFTPLAMSLRARSPGRRAGPARSASLVITMVLIGLWHASTGTYVVWGILQGVILAVHASRRAQGARPWPAWAGRLATLAALLAGWVLLRSSDLAMAGQVYAALLGLRGVEPTPIPGVSAWFVAALVALVAITSTGVDASTLEPRRSWAFAAATAALLTIGLLALGAETPFVYLQF